MTSWAVCYSVKNEAQLLRQVLPLLRWQGCSRVYLYWDDTTDEGPEVAAEHPFARGRPSVEPGELRDPRPWVRELLPRWQENMDIRKRINCLDAARRATEEGIEWLACIDPDEVLVPSLTGPLEPSSLLRFLENQPAAINHLLLPNCEAVPEFDCGPEAFTKATLFAARHPGTELVVRAGKAALRALRATPRVQAQFEDLAYTARFLGAPRRALRHPMTGAPIPAGLFLGYVGSKTFIRARAGARSRANIHTWQEDEVTLRTRSAGHTLHYDLCSADYFAQKFRQRQPVLLVAAFHTRYELAGIARELSPEAARAFFEQSLCISQEAAQRLLARGALLRYGEVARVFRDLARET